MNKDTKISEVYKPNEKVKITVVQKPIVSEDNGKTYYHRDVTIKIKAGISEDKLAFPNAKEFETFLEDIDFDDPNEQLNLGD